MLPQPQPTQQEENIEQKLLRRQKIEEELSDILKYLV